MPSELSSLNELSPDETAAVLNRHHHAGVTNWEAHEDGLFGGPNLEHDIWLSDAQILASVPELSPRID